MAIAAIMPLMAGEPWDNLNLQPTVGPSGGSLLIVLRGGALRARRC